MSIESVTTHSVSGGETPGGERVYTIVHRVRTTSNDDGPLTVKAAPGIASYYDAYSFGNETDLGAWVNSKKADYVNVRDSRRDWYVTVGYSSALQSAGGSFGAISRYTDPLDRPTVWGGSFAQFTKARTREHNGAPIVNAAGDQIEGITADDSRPTLTAQRNLPDINLSLWAEYRDAVNSDTWLGLKSREAKVNSITWTTERSGPHRYFAVTYAFHILLGGWIDLLENRGWRARTVIGGDPVKITDIVEPAYLDKDGLRLSQAKIDAGEFGLPIFAYLESEMPFADLGLPDRIEA